MVPTPVPFYWLSFYRNSLANPKSASLAVLPCISMFWALMSLWVMFLS